MSRYRWLRHCGALGLLIMSGSCVAPAAETSSPVVAQRPVTSVPVAAASAPRTDFILSGEARQGGTIIGHAPYNMASLTLDGNAIPVAADGTFLIAFDRDAANGAHLVATLASGKQIERYLPVAAGDWHIEYVNTRYTGGAATSAEFQRRRPAELAQIRAARAVNAVSDGWRQQFRWPVIGRLSGVFGSQRVYQGKPGSYHSGSDIAVPTGTPFVAPADGVVTLAAMSPFTLGGKILIIDHGMGLNSAFLHCSRIDVKVGERVKQGQVLGAVGQTGRATGPHLHWSLKWRDARIDPSLLAGPMPG